MHSASLLLLDAPLTTVRCTACRHVLLEVGENFRGVIRAKCRKCKTINTITQ
jgi:phage FluMu protein Com